MSQFDRYQLQLVYLAMEHHPVGNQEKASEVSQTTFDTFNQSQPLLHTLPKSFCVCFSSVFTFLEIIKHNMPKMMLFSPIFNI